MNEMPEPPKLSEDQLKRITATLDRIRGGLERVDRQLASEPAHLFTPRMQDAKRL